MTEHSEILKKYQTFQIWAKPIELNFAYLPPIAPLSLPTVCHTFPVEADKHLPLHTSELDNTHTPRAADFSTKKKVQHTIWLDDRPVSISQTVLSFFSSLLFARALIKD